jgi:hypothetical protein
MEILFINVNLTELIVPNRAFTILPNLVVKRTQYDHRFIAINHPSNNANNLLEVHNSWSICLCQFQIETYECKRVGP